MRLTRKDAAATGVTAVVVALYVAFLAGANLPLVSGPRAVGTVVLALGMVGCALGDPGNPANRARAWWMPTMAALGTVSLAAALVVIVAGSHLVLAILVASTVALWLLATLRHAFGGTATGRVTDRDLRQLVEHEQKSRLS
jgi:hypothetical protein